MEQMSLPQNAPKVRGWKRFGIPLLLGLPFITGLLIVTQLDGRSRWHTVFQQYWHQQFSLLTPPYRYGFYESLPTHRNPVVGVQREIAFYQQQVREQPQRGLAQAALAIAYLRMARTSGEGSWYLLAEQAAQRSLTQLPVDNPDAIAVLARVAEARHDFAGALRWAAKIPDSRDALAIQTTANLAIGNLAAASQSADALVESSLNLNAFTLQAIVRAAQGKDAEALQSFQHALEVEEAGEMTNSARVRTLLGRFYYERGQLQKAADLYREAIAILPGYPLALLNLAQLEIRNGNYGTAWQYYDQIASNNPVPTLFEPLILRGRARILQLRGDRAGAEALWQQAETRLRSSESGPNASTYGQAYGQSNGQTFGHRRDLARLLLERGKPEDVQTAVDLMQAEVKLRRDAETLETLATALFQAGRLAEAQTAIQTAIATSRRDAALLDRAAAIAQALGNPSAANRFWQQIKSVDPSFDDRARQAAGLGAGFGS
jgi:tetratricopeptide (TPR) repeat protein